MKPLITDAYRQLNAQLHASHESYGTHGHELATEVTALCQRAGTQDVLDYGCGKSTLAASLAFPIHQYDPAIPEHAALPQPADIVVCTDVLEHIEPELIDNVLNHLQTLVKRYGLFIIATEPAMKTLADGRNAHLIVQPQAWWIEKLQSRFHMLKTKAQKANFVALVAPLKL